MRKKRKDAGRKRRPYKKRVSTSTNKKVVSMQQPNQDNTTDKYGQRGSYTIGVYSDRSPQEDNYRKTQLDINTSRIKRQKTADTINAVREARGWTNTISNILSRL